VQVLTRKCKSLVQVEVQVEEAARLNRSKSLRRGTSCTTTASTLPAGDADIEPPRWRFERVAHPAGDRVFNGLWAAPDGALVAVGQFGLIMTNRGGGGVRGVAAGSQHADVCRTGQRMGRDRHTAGRQ